MIAASTGSLASYPFSGAGIRPHSFIETAGEINEFMKMHGVNLAENGLKQAGKWIYGAVIGLAYLKISVIPGSCPLSKSLRYLSISGSRCKCTTRSSPRSGPWVGGSPRLGALGRIYVGNGKGNL